MKTTLVIIIAVLVLLAAGLLTLRNKRKKSREKLASQGGTFSIIQGEVDGRPLVAIIDSNLRDSPVREGLPFSLSLSSPLITPTGEGLPTQSDADSLNSWEDSVEARLRSVNKFAFIGRVTWNGHREMLYYVDSQKPAVDALKMLSDEHSTRPFAFACERDEKWTKGDFWLNRH
jgi:hypothetical protein